MHTDRSIQNTGPSDTGRVTPLGYAWVFRAVTRQLKPTTFARLMRLPLNARRRLWEMGRTLQDYRRSMKGRTTSEVGSPEWNEEVLHSYSRDLRTWWESLPPSIRTGLVDIHTLADYDATWTAVLGVVAMANAPCHEETALAPCQDLNATLADLVTEFVEAVAEGHPSELLLHVAAHHRCSPTSEVAEEALSETGLRVAGFVDKLRKGEKPDKSLARIIKKPWIRKQHKTAQRDAEKSRKVRRPVPGPLDPTVSLREFAEDEVELVILGALAAGEPRGCWSDIAADFGVRVSTITRRRDSLQERIRSAPA